MACLSMSMLQATDDSDDDQPGKDSIKRHLGEAPDADAMIGANLIRSGDVREPRYVDRGLSGAAVWPQPGRVQVRIYLVIGVRVNSDGTPRGFAGAATLLGGIPGARLPEEFLQMILASRNQMRTEAERRRDALLRRVASGQNLGAILGQQPPYGGGVVQEFVSGTRTLAPQDSGAEPPAASSSDDEADTEGQA